MTFPSRALIVLNPTAGRRHRRRLGDTLAALAARGVSVELLETRHAGHATDLAREAAQTGEPVVIAAGGDGTVSEVVNGLLSEPAAARGCALGILPMGTANVLAHELRIPMSPRRLAELVASHRTRPIWPGLKEQAGTTRRFVQMVGAGFDAHVVHRVNQQLKRRVGGLAYAWQGLLESGRYRYPPIEVVLDGVPTRTHGVIVSKGRLYAGRFTLAADASPLKPDFTVALFDRPGALSALACGVAMPFNQMSRLPGVRLLAARHVEVRGDEVPVQADGDPMGMGAFEVRAATRPLDVLTN